MQTKKPIKKTEHQEQVALFKWAHSPEMLKKYPELGCMFAIPNGGWRTPRQASGLIHEGVLPGVPDIFLPAPRRHYHGFFIEMKREGGRLSDDQEEMILKLVHLGYYANVCFGFEAARDAIIAYLESGVQGGSPVRLPTRKGL